jgi:iron complex transport system ATP-binding protein
VPDGLADRRSATIADVIVDVRGLVVRRAGRIILGPIDWQVGTGERWVVLGPNGSGKTTLLSVVALTLWPTAGTVEVLGSRYGKVDVRDLRMSVGSAGSAVEAVLRPDLRAVDLVMTARNAATEPWWHEYTEANRADARTALGRVGMTASADQPFGTLSAGERRRVSIARALMPDPDLLLLDEPAASLDLGARETLLADLTALAAEPRPAGIVLVSHHLEEVPPGFDHALVLKGGRVVAAGPRDRVLTGPILSEAYGVPLVIERRDGRAWARLDGTGRSSDMLASHGTGRLPS